MLQIATGRLFTRGIARTNRLRGTIYTNAIFPYDMEHIELATGRLLPPSPVKHTVSAVAYEFLEHMELEEGENVGEFRPGILVSSSAAPYVLDFATVCSFALNCICSPDVELVRRLTGSQPSVSTGQTPSKFISEIYAADTYCSPEKIAFLQDFVHQIVRLPRVKFLGAMRAIRTYVVAVHRVADDLELAYTLFVASVESLVQDFDGHQSDWESIDERKRVAMDAALSEAEPAIANKVRQALIETEHASLGKRFRDFCIAHIDASYFRDEATKVQMPIARVQLTPCLREAYNLRSKYVHSLKKLPDAISGGHVLGDVAIDVDGRFFLSIAGISRLTRRVITNFVMKQDVLEREPYNYRHERHGIVVMRLAPQYWLGNADGDITTQGKQRLEGFLEQLLPVLIEEPSAALTDLRQVLTAANEFIPRLTQALRRPYLALLLLFNWGAPAAYRVSPSTRVRTLMDTDLSTPCIEGLICCAVIGITPQYSVEQQLDVLETHFQRIGKASAYRLPRSLEAGLILSLAERFRIEGNIAQCKRMVSLAVDNHPGHTGLLNLEATFTNERTIAWLDVLRSIGDQTSAPQALPHEDGRDIPASPFRAKLLKRFQQLVRELG
jgi:hypothetical protein